MYTVDNLWEILLLIQSSKLEDEPLHESLSKSKTLCSVITTYLRKADMSYEREEDIYVV